MKWNDCLFIWDGNKFTSDFVAKRMLPSFKNYESKYGKDHRVWYDCLADKFFGHGLVRENEPYEFSFFTREGKFLKDKEWGRKYVNGYYVPLFGKDYIEHSECIYSNTPRFKEYKDKTLLIVGGGPSAVEYDWQSVNTDYIWSCNHFFLNPVLANMPVDLFMVSNEVRINQDENLHKYMKKFPRSMALFETTTRKNNQIAIFHKKFKGRVCYVHTRYRSRLGSMPRIMCLAALLNFSKIYFVGMDGLPTKKTKHAFQPGKKLKGAPIKPDAKNVFRRQYVIFWDYMINVLKPNTEFYNLGEGIEGNLSTDVSRSMFPLSRLKEDCNK